MSLLGKLVDPFNITGINEKTKIPPPTKPKLLAGTREVLGVFGQTTPEVQAFEQQARAGYGDINLQEAQRAAMGYSGLVGQLTPESQQQLLAARGAEYAGMTGQAGAVRGLLGAISPESERMMQLQQQAAERAYASSYGLTSQEQRSAEQQAREAFGSSGRLGGNAAVASEILNREESLARKRAEASKLGQQAYSTSQNFYGPAQNLLAGTPSAMDLSGKYATVGMGQIGQATPKLFDYSVGFGIAGSDAAAQNAYNQAKYQQELQQKQMLFSLIGAGVGAAAGGPQGAQIGMQMGKAAAV